MVVFDASVLLLLLDPDARASNDPETEQPVEHAKARIEHLIATLEQQRTKVIIPTPVLSEVLVRAGVASPAYLEELNRSARFRIVPFDVRAAVELAALTREALDAGDKREGSTAPWQKVKLDRQIVAIARTEEAVAIYSDDEDLRRFARRVGLEVIRICDLPLPREDQQGSLDLG